ncbi:SEC14 cytosolic factor-like [Magnolia sinica]|uniref:SEC14 cytosolic factor-like n=1 Tax=Magnolia sinica TaxID=86752 RepID=UPI00265AAA06|nr:SEC14 cytosolic factor-like [Magnolia sinica]
MGKKELLDKEKINAVLQILRKQAPLTVKQEKFCNDACLVRFLKAKGDSVKKAAKHLRACLSWRENIDTEHLIADEFSAELADGIAYVAGNDQEARPVMVFRVKQDYQKLHSQKLYIRLLVFTLEVAIASMSRNVEEFVLLFDASFFRSGSAFLNLLLATLKIVSEYYPGRLHKAFVIDPPSLFSCLWKGVRPFVELSTVTMVVSSLDFEESLDDTFSSYPRTTSLRFEPSSVPTKIGGSSSSRFSFTVSHFDSLKPWYLTRTDTSASSQVGHFANASPSLMGPALVSPLNARSFSFASPATRTLRGGGPKTFPSTPQPTRHPRTPRPSFLQSPAAFFRKDCQISSRTDRCRESFFPYLRYYRNPYNEMIYRSKMRPPLGGLISIVSPQLKRRHVTSQRF